MKIVIEKILDDEPIIQKVRKSKVESEVIEIETEE